MTNPNFDPSKMTRPERLHIVSDGNPLGTTVRLGEHLLPATSIDFSIDAKSFSEVTLTTQLGTLELEGEFTLRRFMPVGPKAWEHEGHLPTQHRDGKPPWCNACGWSSPIPAASAVQYKEIN